MTEEEAAYLVAATVAWHDTEALLGREDDRTVAALERVRQRVREVTRDAPELVEIDPPRPHLTVIRGGVE
jgi:hypothetical protein